MGKVVGEPYRGKLDVRFDEGTKGIKIESLLHRGSTLQIDTTVDQWYLCIMPRLARLDAPGVLHHIIIRGIERRAIFKDDFDRENFVKRLSTLVPETQTICYAWVLMPNHAHFLLRSGSGGIANLMRRLLTGYAVSFNHRHRRHGQLFQNRYNSILVPGRCIF